MKRFASLLMAVLMLCTMLTVFAVPASAAGEPVEISASQLNKISCNSITCNSIIKEPGEYEVESIAIYHNVKLIIGEGVTIKVATAFVNKGTIEVLGTLDISQCGGTGRERIIIGDTGELIDWYDENDAVAGNGEVIPKSSFGSMLSQGSLTIICTVSAAVVFGLGGFFIGKAAGKKKKPATAGGENTDEE